jgi:glycine dehydrogenase subunit 2
MAEPLIFDYHAAGGRNFSLPAATAAEIPEQAMRQSLPELPQASELQVVRHYTRLSQLNFSIDTQFYPLGSCTMKYNPKV